MSGEEVIRTTSGCDAMMGGLLGSMANKENHSDPMAMAAIRPLDECYQG